MNREQMIAWLTIEGWEPRVGTGTVPVVTRGSAMAFYNHSAHYNPNCYRIHNNFVPCEWAKFTDTQLRETYEEINRKCG